MATFKRGYKTFGKSTSKSFGFFSMHRLKGGKPEVPFVVMARRKGGAAVKSGGLFGLTIQWDSEGLDVAIGAASLCAYVSMALLLHHANAISKGQRPAGGAQKGLDPDGEQGRRAKAGERPDIRGNRGRPGSLPPNLTRSAVSASGKIVRIGGGQLGFTARASIYPHFAKQAEFIDKEQGLGNEFFSVSGDADRVIEDVVIDYMASVFDGVRHYDPSKTKAGGR